MVKGEGDDKRDGVPSTGNPYADWALRLINEDPNRLRLLGMIPPDADKTGVETPLWLPISLRIDGDAIQEFRERFVPEKYNPNEPGDVVVENWQFGALEFGEPKSWDIVAYVRMKDGKASVEFPDYVSVLRRDPPVTQFQLPQMAEDGSTTGMLFTREAPFRQGPQNPKKAPKTMVGIIDDGIGFLNGRFMRNARSRFAAHWIMSDPTGWGVMPNIQALASQLNTRTEAEIYDDLAKAAYWPGTSHRMLDLRTHGTAMLDFAAGAEPFDTTDPVRDVELLGVQIRPRSYDDTSGAGITPDLQRGLLFLWLMAWFHGAERLMVNISLGITAGPKDGTSDVEIIIRDAINIAAIFGVQMEVFLPYGNSYHDQLAAEMKVEPKEPNSIEWQIQPDDLTPGYFEIQQLDGAGFDLNTLEFTVTAPDGTQQAIAANAAGVIDSAIVMNGVTCGHVTFVPMNANGRRAHIVVAFAPSRANPEMALPGPRPCPAGRWKLDVASPKDAVHLTFQMQRDDRPAGVLPGARQAYFEGENTRDFDSNARQFTGLGSQGPLVYRGTNSAYSEVNHTNVTSVGGAMVRPQQTPANDPQVKPASYTAEGAIWSGSEPTCGAVTEKNAALPGLRGAGTFSSATARMSGTSTASATALRHRLEASLGVGLADVEAIFGPDRARLGTSVILDNRAARRRA